MIFADNYNYWMAASSRAAADRPLEKSRSTGAARNVMVETAAGWERFPWVVHGFSTRQGGVSKVYSSDRSTGEMNLGHTDCDPRAHVDSNRKLFLRELGAVHAKLVTTKQVHSGMIHRVTRENSADVSNLKGDGLITNEPELLLGIRTADCVPVLVVDPVNRAVGAFHAGWRGTVARIVERGVGLMQAEFGSNPAKLHAAIGPAIGQCCYSVGEELVHEFESQFAYSKELFREVYDSDPVKKKYPMLFLTARAPGHSNIGPQIHLDLAEANRRQLLDAGVHAKNIWLSGECTECHSDKYFSHRAESGFTGRMMAVVGIR